MELSYEELDQIIKKTRKETEEKCEKEYNEKLKKMEQYNLKDNIVESHFIIDHLDPLQLGVKYFLTINGEEIKGEVPVALNKQETPSQVFKTLSNSISNIILRKDKGFAKLMFDIMK